MPFDAGAAEDDDALMVRLAAGDERAARLLAQRHAPRALALARAMLRDPAEAEDIAQEAMLRLWRQAPKWRAGEAKASTWLHRVVSNMAIDRMRRRRWLSDGEAPERADDAPSADERLHLAARGEAVRAAVAALPERQRAALTLRHFAELSNPEIAQRLEISVEAVESLLARARRGLGKALSGRRRSLGLE